MGESPFIAIVDDEEPVRIALGRLLRSSGLAVRTFASGAEFLASLPEPRPGCLVLDMHMPGLSGIEVLCHLNLGRFGIPVVVITGKDDVGVRAEILSLGASAYLSKPIDGDVLLSELRRAMEPPRAG